MTNATTRRRRRLVRLGLLALAGTALVPGGARAGEDFVAGSGRARASIFEVVPRTGGLTIPVTFGRASASFQGTAAEASSVAMKAPEGSASPVADCGERNPGGGGGGGAPSPGTQNPFASTVKVSSKDDDSEAGRRATSFASPPGSPVHGAGSEQEVAATDDPSSRALTVEGRFGFVDLVGYTQARAEAHAGVVDGRARVAGATVTLDRLDLFDGMVTMERLRWVASQRTGEDPHAEGAFTVGSVSVAGTPLPAPPAPPSGEADPLAALNVALAPTGVAVETPRVEAAEGGVVRVSPMTVRMSDSPLGRAVLGPVVGALQPVRDPLVEQLLSFSCDFGAAITVADVVASIATGSGGVSFDVGGVSAGTEGTRYDNPFDGPLDDPFGGAPPELPPVEPVAPVTLPDTSDLTAALPAYEAPPFTSDYAYPPAPAAPSVPALEERAAPLGSLVRPALGPSSRRLEGDKGGVALVVGALGLIAVLVLAAADAVHLRRAARTIP